MDLAKRAAVLIAFLVGFSSSAQTADCSCCTEEHQAFDFWIGKWNVTDTQGKLVGTNVIEKVQDDCVLRENWKGTSGATGTSTNFFNSTTKQWEQLWVDNSGSHLKLKGDKKGNQMILSSDEFTHTDGNKYTNRITWTANKDGSVRQLWEILKEGKVVNVAFDGLYQREN